MERSHSDVGIVDDGKVAGPILTATQDLFHGFRNVCRGALRDPKEDDTGGLLALSRNCQLSKVLVKGDNDPLFLNSQVHDVGVGHTRERLTNPKHVIVSIAKQANGCARDVLVSEDAHQTARAG